MKVYEVEDFSLGDKHKGDRIIFKSLNDMEKAYGDIDNGRDFTSYMIKMSTDTDGDSQIDEWFFSAADNTGTDQDPIIEYTIVGPVGGVASPVNKFDIIAPYVALAGLIAVASTLFIIKRRKD